MVIAADFPTTIDLEIVGANINNKGFRCTLNICVAECRDSSGVPSLENLSRIVSAELGNLTNSIYGSSSGHVITFARSPPLFHYIDQEGHPILLHVDDDVSFLDALGEFAEEMSLKMQVEANFPLMTEIKLCLVGIGHGSRRCYLNEILDANGNPSMAKLLALALELKNTEHESDPRGQISLVYKNRTESYLLDSDDALCQHAAGWHEAGCARPQSPVFKIMVQATQFKSLRLVSGQQALSIPADILMDSQSGLLSYANLEALARKQLDCVESLSTERILFSFSSRNKVLPQYIRNDGELKSALRNTPEYQELRVVCRRPSIVKNFFAMFGVLLAIALGVLAPSFSFQTVPQPMFQTSLNGQDMVDMVDMDDPTPMEHKEKPFGAAQIMLAPLNATLHGRHCQFRKHPHQHILFFHKSNMARWAIPDGTKPGLYAAWTQVSRRGPAWTKIHAGVLIPDDEEEHTAYHYRKKLKEMNVQPTGSWNRFRYYYMGDFQVTCKTGEMFVVVAGEKMSNVDFQGIVLTWTSPLN